MKNYSSQIMNLREHGTPDSLAYARLITAVWLGGVAVRALDLRLEIAGLIPAAALSGQLSGAL